MMKKTIILSLLLLTLYNGTLFSQKHRGNEIPVFKEISGLQEVKKTIQGATELVKINEVWFKVVDNQNQTLGYCLSSKPYSEGITGYHGTTPVVIILNKEKKIIRITMLSHSETASYIDLLNHRKFFNSWYGMTVRDAMNAKAPADSYSGATITALAIRKNIDILLRKAYENRI